LQRTSNIAAESALRSPLDQDLSAILRKIAMDDHRESINRLARHSTSSFTIGEMRCPASGNRAKRTRATQTSNPIIKIEDDFVQRQLITPGSTRPEPMYSNFSAFPVSLRAASESRR